MILKHARKLTGTRYYKKKCFSKQTVENRKENCERIKELRKNGKYAVLIYDKVLRREKESPENTS